MAVIKCTQVVSEKKTFPMLFQKFRQPFCQQKNKNDSSLINGPNVRKICGFPIRGPWETSTAELNCIDRGNLQHLYD